MSCLITNATVIDGVSDTPLEGQSIWIKGDRIHALGRRHDMNVPPATNVIDAKGKYVIPGLINANVHLLCDIRLETLVRYLDHYEDLIAEAAQVALRSGQTTVFDTWGPRRFLMNVRDRINRGDLVGSRIYCAGNILGFDGPISADFIAKSADVASQKMANRINAIWVENVGRHLMWHTPDQVAKEVRSYLGKGIDFVKYAANEHGPISGGAFLQFSPRVQKAIVDEAHRAGTTAQAHVTSVEGLHMAIEAGCDLVTHCNMTGPVPIPQETLDLFVEKKTGAVVFPWTEKGLDWIKKNLPDIGYTMWAASDTNARNLIQCGATLLMATDGMILAPDVLADPFYSRVMPPEEEENLFNLATGHFYWLRAMEEKGCPPMEMLRAATRNVAAAYGKDKDIGTLEPGKIADMLILDKNPLEAAENYRSIHMIIKDGAVVDHIALPQTPILTVPEEPVEEEASYIASIAGANFPGCPLCLLGRH